MKFTAKKRSMTQTDGHKKMMKQRSNITSTIGAQSGGMSPMLMAKAGSLRKDRKQTLVPMIQKELKF